MYEEFETHQTFQSIEELNEAVRLGLYYNASELNKTDVAVYKLLSRFSCVVPGVSWMKVKTMAEHMEKSEKTIRRSLKKLEQLELIKRVPTIREKGGRGHDICIIQPVVQSKMSSRENAEMSTGSKANKEEDYKETLTNKQNNYVLDESFTPSTVPEQFINACKPFFGAKDIYSLWQRVKIAYTQCNLDANLYSDYVVSSVVQVFKGAIFMQKTGRLRKTFRGYFYKGCLQAFDRIFAEELEGLYEGTPTLDDEFIFGKGLLHSRN